MEARLDIFSNPLAMKVMKYINSAGAVVTESTLPSGDPGAGEAQGQPDQWLRLLRRHALQGRRAQRRDLSAAQPGGHVAGGDGLHGGRAGALELAEQGTRIADAAGGVTDEVWQNAVKHYDEEQLAALVAIIALINFYNRINVIIQQPAGSYEPGTFG